MQSFFKNQESKSITADDKKLKQLTACIDDENTDVSKEKDPNIIEHRLIQAKLIRYCYADQITSKPVKKSGKPAGLQTIRSQNEIFKSLEEKLENDKLIDDENKFRYEISPKLGDKSVTEINIEEGYELLFNAKIYIFFKDYISVYDFNTGEYSSNIARTDKGYLLFLQIHAFPNLLWQASGEEFILDTKMLTISKIYYPHLYDQKHPVRNLITGLDFISDSELILYVDSPRRGVIIYDLTSNNPNKPEKVLTYFTSCQQIINHCIFSPNKFALLSVSYPKDTYEMALDIFERIDKNWKMALTYHLSSQLEWGVGISLIPLTDDQLAIIANNNRNSLDKSDVLILNITLGTYKIWSLDSLFYFNPHACKFSSNVLFGRDDKYICSLDIRNGVMTKMSYACNDIQKSALTHSGKYIICDQPYIERWKRSIICISYDISTLAPELIYSFNNLTPLPPPLNKLILNYCNGDYLLIQNKELIESKPSIVVSNKKPSVMTLMLKRADNPIFKKVNQNDLESNKSDITQRNKKCVIM